MLVAGLLTTGMLAASGAVHGTERVHGVVTARDGAERTITLDSGRVIRVASTVGVSFNFVTEGDAIALDVERRDGESVATGLFPDVVNIR